MIVDVKAAIPHREPFLLVDRVLEIADESIRAETTLRADDELWSRVYTGHYPGQPITPGVLTLEMIFQTAAILLHGIAGAAGLSGTPVVTRIQNVKFKTMILPGDTVEIRAALGERMANAFFMKGGVWKDGRAAVQAEFAVALAPAADGSAG